jgi:hypothetical protein
MFLRGPTTHTHTHTHTPSVNAGAYFMRPIGNSTLPVGTAPVSLTLVQGPVVSEARQVRHWVHVCQAGEVALSEARQVCICAASGQAFFGSTKHTHTMRVRSIGFRPLGQPSRAAVGRRSRRAAPVRRRTHRHPRRCGQGNRVSHRREWPEHSWGLLYGLQWTGHHDSCAG